MKKSTILFGVVAIVAMVMVSCQMDKPTFQEADLLGLWSKGDATGLDSVPVEFVRFTAEQDETGEYKYGRQWNESEDIYEEDLVPYGNGWFMWKKDGDEVVEIHMTDKQIAVIPFEYEIMELSSQEMRYKESTDADKQEFKKVKI